jgi:hypothetical protein
MPTTGTQRAPGRLQPHGEEPFEARAHPSSQPGLQAAPTSEKWDDSQLEMLLDL